MSSGVRSTRWSPASTIEKCTESATACSIVPRKGSGWSVVTCSGTNDSLTAVRNRAKSSCSVGADAVVDMAMSSCLLHGAELLDESPRRRDPRLDGAVDDDAVPALRPVGAREAQPALSAAEQAPPLQELARSRGGPRLPRPRVRPPVVPGALDHLQVGPPAFDELVDLIAIIEVDGRVIRAEADEDRGVVIEE